MLGAPDCAGAAGPVRKWFVRVEIYSKVISIYETFGTIHV